MKVALIGLGKMGKNHLRVLKSIEGISEIIVCDNVFTEDINYKKYTSVDDLISNETIDSAIIVVPTFLHKEIALQCIEKKINVFIEKPLASNVKEGNEILASIMKNNVIGAVGHIERFNPVVLQLKEEIGNTEIYSISITRVGPFPPRISDVGVLTDLSVHDIDLIRFITRKKIIDGKIFRSRKIHNHHEDNAVLSFELEDNIVANITTNWLTPFKKRKIEVATQRAYYEADLITQELKEYSAYKINNSYIIRDCFVKKGEPLAYELSAYFDSLKRKPNANLATIEDGISILKVLEDFI
ncbi:MAG: Gfo/Idh/MocA family oxidoreductase [Actinobacteria bacterium]|nr:Gfo/Idh/MocA family oxidoreductase [Actinomycetota bacterium]